MSEYPEHDKLHAVKDQSQAIGSFLDWLQNERKPRTVLAIHEWDEWVPTNERIEALLAEYFEIDLKKLEEEKRAMLDELRKANERRNNV
jgi:hypothetical protein